MSLIPRDIISIIKKYKKPKTGEEEAIPVSETMIINQEGMTRLVSQNDKHISLEHFINCVKDWRKVKDMIEQGEKMEKDGYVICDYRDTSGQVLFIFQKSQFAEDLEFEEAMNMYFEGLKFKEFLKSKECVDCKKFKFIVGDGRCEECDDVVVEKRRKEFIEKYKTASTSSSANEPVEKKKKKSNFSIELI